MTTYILSIVLGFLGVFILYFPLGLFIVNRFAFEQTLLKIVLSFYVGFALVSSAYFFIGNLTGLSTRYLDFILLIIGVCLLPVTLTFFRESGVSKKTIKVFCTLNKSTSRLRIFSILAALTLYMTVALSGFPIGDNRYIQSGLDHDSYWHVALVRNLTESIPPLHPSSYAVVLTNYHYFYDILFVPVIRLFSPDIFALYFQVFPLILVLLLSFSASLLAERVLKKHEYLLPFFVFFGGSFAFLLPIFIKGIKWGESSFWVSQTFATMINPQAIYTFGLLYVVIILLYETTKEKIQANITGLMVLILFLIASAMGFKSYSFLVLAVLFFSFLGHSLLLNRNIKKAAILSGIFVLFSIPYFIFVVGIGGASSFIYLPLWFLSSMIESRDRVYYPVLKLQEEHYLAHGNYLRVVEIKLKEFVIFFVGNLGTRIVLVLLFLKSAVIRQLKEDTLLVSILAAFIFSCSFPLIFLQKGIVWNTIQFWYYGLILANILVSLVLSDLLSKINLQIVRRVVLLSIIFLTLPTFLATFWSRATHYYSISLGTELWLKANLNKNDRVLICPSSDFFFDTSFVKMYSSASVLLADPVQLSLVSSPAYNYLETLKEAFRISDKESVNKIIFENRISKILCSDNTYLPLIKDVSNGEIYIFEKFYVKEI